MYSHLSNYTIQDELLKDSQREPGDHSTSHRGKAITDGNHCGSCFQHAHDQLQHHQPYKERSGLPTQTHTYTRNHDSALLQNVQTNPGCFSQLC